MHDLVFADTDRFLHDTIDDETVIIDAQSGHLFLFTGVGPWLWGRLITGATFEALVDAMTVRYGAASAAPTLGFLEALMQQGLLSGTPRSAAAPEIDLPALPDVFASPRVEKYEDIADIVAMDPIHDIEQDLGWPHAPGVKPAS